MISRTMIRSPNDRELIVLKTGIEFPNGSGLIVLKTMINSTDANVSD